MNKVLDKLSIVFVFVFGLPLGTLALVFQFQPQTIDTIKVEIIERKVGGTGRYLEAHQGQVSFKDENGQLVWVATDGYIVHAGKQNMCLTRKVGKWIYKVNYVPIPPSTCFDS